MSGNFNRPVPWFRSIRWSRTDKVAAAIIGAFLAIVIACSGCVAVGNTLNNIRPANHRELIASGPHATAIPTPTDTPWPTFTPAPTATPAQPKVVFDVRSSIQQERTSAFTLQGSSQTVQWWCDPSSSIIGSYNVIIEFYTADGTDTYQGISDICESGNTSGQQTFYMPAGTYKLDLFIQGWWHIKVTDLP